MRKIKGWFRCEYPGCDVETDSGYVMIWENKKIRVCKNCLKKIKEAKRGNTELYNVNKS